MGEAARRLLRRAAPKSRGSLVRPAARGARRRVPLRDPRAISPAGPRRER